MPDTEEKTTVNFSCNLDIETEMTPFDIMAKELGIDKTTYFRKMLANEIKNKPIYKKLKI